LGALASSLPEATRALGETGQSPQFHWTSDRRQAYSRNPKGLEVRRFSGVGVLSSGRCGELHYVSKSVDLDALFDSDLKG